MKVRFNWKDLVRDMHVIGLHTHLNAIAMAMQTDRNLQMFLSAAPDFQLSLPNGDLSVHRQFQFQHLEEHWQAWLLENKGSSQWLLKTKPFADYFLVLHGEIMPHFAADCAKALKQCNAVNMAYVLPETYLLRCPWLIELLDPPTHTS